MVEIQQQELDNLKDRAKKLATEKSYLQLIVQLMSKIGSISGLDDTIDNLLRQVVDVIGGANLILYYQIDEETFYADLYGKKQKLTQIDDPQVLAVYQHGEPIEYQHDFKDTQLVSAEFTHAYTWVYPLKVGNQLIGVFKMESLHIAMRGLYQHLPLFFNYVALILKNEILGYTRLQKINQQLEQEIAQRKLMEKDLRKAKSVAEAANQAKSVFLANMSHELRTPMNAVLGFSRILQDDPDITPAQRQSLDIINRSGSHLLNLINDILDMAKIEAGRIVIEPEPFDLGELIRDIVDMMRERAENKHLQLLHEEKSGFPRFIEADPYKLRQILINLIGNAIKYTDQGSICLRLDIQPDPKKSQRSLLICEIEDTGVGIAPEDQKKIFKPFVQVGKQTSQKGTGLGLPITQQYIKLMGGNISVSSVLDAGSLFRIELPVQKVSELEIMQIKPNQNRVIGLRTDQPVYRLLAVDDQMEGRLLLKKLLQPLGFELREASNGQEAVDVFRQWQPDLIWMDMRMPVMDGITATAQIRALAEGKKTIIVALTASVFQEQQSQLLKSGFDAFISKPYRIEEIFNCLSHYLGVQFVYETAQTTAFKTSESSFALRASHIKTLPEDLQIRLYAAAAELDMEQALMVINEIKALDINIGTSLQYHVEQMDFQAILDFYETAKQPV